MAQVLFWAYIKLIRRWLSPLIYWTFRFTVFRHRIFPEMWAEIKDMGPDEFSGVLLSYGYLHDPLQGFLDYSPEEHDFFFVERTTARDCDAWARMWFWYWRYHGRPVWEVAICTRRGKNAHMVTVAEVTEGMFGLFDYTPKGVRESIPTAILDEYPDHLWVINKQSKG